MLRKEIANGGRVPVFRRCDAIRRAPEGGGRGERVRGSLRSQSELMKRHCRADRSPGSHHVEPPSSSSSSSLSNRKTCQFPPAWKPGALADKHVSCACVTAVTHNPHARGVCLSFPLLHHPPPHFPPYAAKYKMSSLHSGRLFEEINFLYIQA